MDVEARLARELAEMRARLGGGSPVALLDDEGPAAADGRAIADAIDHVQRSIERDMALATRSRLQERAQRLLGALQRLREGRYGLCEDCGEEIATERIAALPEVTTCVACQRQRERSASRASAEVTPLFADSD